MTKIRTALNAYLKTLCSTVYFQVASKDAVFPYIVYNVALYPDGEGFERVVLDVDGWDCNETNDTTAVENLMTALKPLDKHTLSTADTSVTFYIDSKVTLTDTDPRIKRRKYIYTGKLFNKE